MWGEGENMQCKPLGKINYFILFKRIKRVLELNFEIFLCAKKQGTIFEAFFLCKLHNNSMELYSVSVDSTLL